MNPNYLLKLYHYENWANQLVLSCMVEHSLEDEKMIFLDEPHYQCSGNLV